MKISLIDKDTEKQIEEKIDTIMATEKDIRDAITISNEQVRIKCKGITREQLKDYLTLESVYVFFNLISATTKILTRTNKHIIPHIEVQDNVVFKNFVTDTFDKIEEYENNFLNLEDQNFIWYDNTRELFYIIPFTYKNK